MKIVILGSGNVATLLGISLLKAGYNIVQVWSRNRKHAATLAKLLHTQSIDDITKVDAHADLYIISVSDDAIPLLSSQLNSFSGIVVHTSGSTPIDIFANKYSHYGVFYPFQTFSKEKEIDFADVPILLESSDSNTSNILHSIASSISTKTQECTSEQRKVLHIAAVFSSNFTNYFYTIAQKLLEDNKLDFDLIRPLIMETALKVQKIMPAQAQTGPASRKDITIINNHLKQLSNSPELVTIYRLLSEQIITSSKQN